MNTPLNKNDIAILGINEILMTVYCDCLSHTHNTPTDISKRTGIKRTTLYSYLDQLKSMGFLYEKIKIKRKYYYPFPVQDALDNFEIYKKKQIDEYSENKKSLSKKLQNISAHSQANLTQSVSRYYGKEGMLHLASLLLKIDQDVDLFGPTLSLFSIMDEQTMFKKYSVKRLDSQRRTRDIIDPSYLQNPRSHLRSPIFSKIKTLAFPDHIDAVVAFSGDYVCFAKRANNKPEAIVIEDRQYADLLRFLYDQLWDTLPLVDIKKIRLQKLD